MDINSPLKLFEPLLFAGLLVREIKSYLRLSKFSGPRLAAFSRLWYLKQAVGGKWGTMLREMDDKYDEFFLKQSRRILYHVFVFVSSSTGPTVRVGPNHLITSNPDLIKKTNTVRSTYTRGQFYEGASIYSTEATYFPSLARPCIHVYTPN